MINKKNLLVDSSIILFFSFLAIAYAYPLAFKMRSTFFGDPQWTFDTKGTIYNIWLTKYQWLNKIPFTFNPLVAFPFGADLTSYPSQWGLRISLLILSLWKGEIFSFNFFVLSSYILSAIVVYFLVIHISGNRVSGFISGLVYAFAPYHTLKAFSHLGLSAIQWIPLYVFSLILLEEKRSYTMAIFCGISFVITFLSSYYYGYMCIIITVIFLFIKLIYKQRGGLKLYFTAVCIAFLLIFPCVFNEIKSMIFPGNVEAGFIKPYSDLFTYSARISDYFRPSEYHPIFGKINFWFIKPYLVSSRHWAERTVFLGIAPFILALFGIFYGKVRNKIFGKVFFVFTAFIAFLFSMPPELKIFNIPIYLPNYIMYKIFPMFRCPARFGILVILCISVLAGVGIKVILDKILSKIIRVIITTGVMCFIIFEFAVIPPFRNVDLSRIPEVYKWLSNETADKVVVEYPFIPDFESAHNDIYLFYQRVHKKKLINGAPCGSLGDAFRRECADLSEMKTLRLLAYLGADYIIVHKEKYNEDELMKIRKNHWLRLVKDFQDAIVYKLTAKPEKLPVMYWQNVGSKEKWEDGRYWRWMGNNATIYIGATDKKIVNIEFKIFSFAKTRTLEFYFNNVLIKKADVIAPSSIDLSMRVSLENILLEKGQNIIRFYTPQGEDRIGDVLHNDDDRRVSFAISGFEVKNVK